MVELAWQEIVGGRIVTKRRTFKSQEAMEKFIDRLLEKDNFYRILAYA